MGLKLETIITLGIIAIIATVFMLKITDGTTAVNTVTKELEFTNTTFTEVDTSDMKGRVFSTYGVRDKGVLTLDNLRYHTDNIELLSAKKGRYEGDKLYLDGDIVLKQKEGFDYSAEHAVYHTKTEILHITSAFEAVMDANIIHGYTLQYDTRKKEAFSREINAVVYTADN